MLTDITGKSHAFERGFVTYTDEAKHELLGVPREVLNTDGAVSEASARAMAEGAIRCSRADVAVSVTGYTEDYEGAPGGLVHFACARRGGAVRHHVQRFTPPGRQEVRLAALRVALVMLRDALVEFDRAA